MFQFRRGLRRLFNPRAPFARPRDGLTGGDPALLELLDLGLLKAEAKASDVAAGRIGARDRPMRQLQQAVAWREVARRTGDVASLRKAASAAELAIQGMSRTSRRWAWALARTEQGLCARLGARLFGDDGLNAAAQVAFAEAAATGGKSFAPAEAALAAAEAATALTGGDQAAFEAAAARFERPLILLEEGDRPGFGRLPAAQARADRAEWLILAGEKFKDDRLFSRAIAELHRVEADLDPAYEPVTWARVVSLRGQACVALGGMIGEPAHIVDGVSVLSIPFDHLTRDHSPLDWAAGHLALAHGLQMLGEATESDQAFGQAAASYERALVVLKRMPALSLGGVATVNRALCLARRAELSLDLFALDEAEAAMRCRLAGCTPKTDPVEWAVLQLSLARLYEARMDVTGRDNGERAKAVMAVSAALDVFGETGNRSLTEAALAAMDRLAMAKPRHRA
jgi:hypothetical protein